MGDIHAHVRQLHQALSSDKIPIAFLLGAGCGCSIRVQEDGEERPLIPDIAGLTRKVAETLNNDENVSAQHALICAQLEEDARQVNIEEILSHIRALQLAAGAGEARGFRAPELRDLDARVCGAIDRSVRKALPDQPTGYHRLASWISAIRREHAAELFTTNYDLLLEQALEAQAVSSESLASVGYDDATQTLEVEFRHGGVYQYFDVPNHVYREFRQAASLGNFLAHHIKGSYRYARV